MKNAFFSLAAVSVLLGGCAAGDPDFAGMESSACLDDACFGELECRSGFCIDPDGEDDDDGGTSNSNPSGTSTSSGTTAGTTASTTGTSTSGTSSTTTSTSGTLPTTETASSTTSDETTAATVAETTTGDSSSSSESSTTDDTSANPCGNGTVGPGEQCDGSDLQGFDCASLGLGTGTLSCDMLCTFDTSMCQPMGGTSG